MKNRIVTYVNPELSVEILNRLFATLDCSFARYLSYARPWARRPYMLLDALARRLRYEHEAFAGKIAKLIAARRGTVNSCVFPMDFTHYNDLSLEFLAPKILKKQHLLADVSVDCAEQLAHDPEAKRLVKKLIASLRRYAALLMELLSPPRLARPLADDGGDKLIHQTASASIARKSVRSRSAEPQSAA